MIVDVDDFLEHYGKKGMRWGSRKQVTGVNASTSRKIKRESRRERKAKEKQARFVADQKKAQDLINEALKSPNVLVRVNRNNILTGKEFVDYMSSGGVMNVRTTDIYARQIGKKGPYQLTGR